MKSFLESPKVEHGANCLDGLIKDTTIPDFVPEYEDHLSDRTRDGDKAEVSCPECGHTFKP